MANFSSVDRDVFLAQNQQEFAELLTFIDFAEGLTIGFIEVNQERDKAILVEALREQFANTEIRLEVFNFSQDQTLRFLRDALMKRLERVKTDRKLVLLIQGLEVAIGMDGVGAYPPILQDLNFVRDAYRRSVPHPLLFVLPDYAITRISKYAPDFWAWQSGLFRFKTSQQSLEQLKVEVFDRPLPEIASNENQAQIEQLQKLLMEVHPSGRPIAPQDVQLCGEIYYKLGSAFLTQRQSDKARDYLLEGLKVIEQHPDQVLIQSLYRKLGNAYKQMRQFKEAVEAHETALEIARSLNQLARVATVLMDLGDVVGEQRQFEKAKEFYRQSLEINETLNDRYAQARTYHQLGIVAQALREFDDARNNYLQALQINSEFHDRYAQARTYHQLGSVAQALREFDDARNNYLQALQINSEFHDRYAQARTYHQLGIVAEELREFDDARNNYLQALQINSEFHDRYAQARTYHQLGSVAQALREFDDARNNYLQALQINSEFHDRYAQASTYYQLGKLAEEIGELEEAKANYLLDLQITAEFNDEYGLEISLRNLARFYQTTQDPDLIQTVAQLFDETIEQVQEYFGRVNGENEA